MTKNIPITRLREPATWGEWILAIGASLGGILIGLSVVLAVGCFHEPSHAVAPVGARDGHPRTRIKAAGLLPILKDFNPRAKALIDGDYVTLAPGVEAQIPANAEIYMSREDDGRVRIDFPNGQKVRIDKTFLGFIPIHGTETVSGILIDDMGVDVEMPTGLIKGVRLEAAE